MREWKRGREREEEEEDKEARTLRACNPPSDDVQMVLSGRCTFLASVQASGAARCSFCNRPGTGNGERDWGTEG